MYSENVCTACGVDFCFSYRQSTAILPAGSRVGSLCRRYHIVCAVLQFSGWCIQNWTILVKHALPPTAPLHLVEPSVQVLEERLNSSVLSSTNCSIWIIVSSASVLLVPGGHHIGTQALPSGWFPPPLLVRQNANKCKGPKRSNHAEQTYAVNYFRTGAGPETRRSLWLTYWLCLQANWGKAHRHSWKVALLGQLTPKYVPKRRPVHTNRS